MIETLRMSCTSVKIKISASRVVKFEAGKTLSEKVE
jgi:nucleoid DNA-binding protein